MTDLEMTKLCAEALKLKVQELTQYDPDLSSQREVIGYTVEGPIKGRRKHYRPLHDDAQAMALLKRFAPELKEDFCKWYDWSVWAKTGSALNGAIVECVAKMQKAKNAPQS